MIKSATPAASANVGISFPIWLNVKAMFLGRKREICAFDLSPIIMMGESASTGFSPSAKARRVALVTEEWIPPQRPLSEEMTIKSLCLAGFSALDCS